MQLAIVFAAILAAVTWELTPAAPCPNAALRLALVVFCTGAVCLAALGCSLLVAIQAATHRDIAESLRVLRQAERLRRMHAPFLLACSLVTYVVLDWPQLVRMHLGLDQAFLLDELALFLPLVVALAVPWFAFGGMQHAIAAMQGIRSTSAARYALAHARFYLGLILLPMLMLYALRDVAAMTAPDVLTGRFAAVALLIPLAGLTIAMPLLVRLVWSLEPLGAGPLRTRLEQRAHAAGVRPREIYVWDTNRMVMNAAVVGFWPSFRYVLLSDRLLSELHPDELEAVFAHELGHIRHRHAWLRLAALSSVAAVGAAVAWGATAGPLAGEAMVGPWALAAILTPLMVLAAAAMTVLRRWFAAWEHAADVFACRLLAGEPESAEQSITCLARALAKLNRGASPMRAFRWHPSTAARVRHLQALLLEP